MTKIIKFPQSDENRKKEHLAKQILYDAIIEITPIWLMNDLEFAKLDPFVEKIKEIVKTHVRDDMTPEEIQIIRNIIRRLWTDRPLKR